MTGEMAGSLLLGTFVLLFVFFFPCSLHYHEAYVSLDFVSFSSLFLRQNNNNFGALQ